MKPILYLFLLVALLKYSHQTPVDKLGFAEDYDLDFNRGGQVKNFFKLDFLDPQVEYLSWPKNPLKRYAKKN